VSGEIREAIVAEIGQRPGRWRVSRRGCALGARPETVRILRTVVRGELALAAVEFEDRSGRPWSWAFGAVRGRDGGWKVCGGAGGGLASGREPWASLGGWRWSGRWCLGGRVHGEQVRAVRLTDAAGSTVEDVVEGGYALLIAPEPARRPLRVELLDAERAVLAAQSWPPRGRP